MSHRHYLPAAVLPLCEPYLTIVGDVSEQDRIWFARRPGVDVRIRKAVPGELGPPMALYAGAWTVVTQLEPGVRHRRLVEAGIPVQTL